MPDSLSDIPSALSSDLPTFRNPPVVETVLGIQFDRIPHFTNAHLGSFWKHLQKTQEAEVRWDNVNDAPPIEPAFERFDDDGAWLRPAMTLRLTQDQSSRLQIRNADSDAMIQVQNGRLHYNWIGKRGADYQRYSVVRPAFDRIVDSLRDFLSHEKLDELRPNQWEVTYVNHIPKGPLWNTPSDWRGIFTTLPGVVAATSEVRLEDLSGSWHFEIPERRGRLHIDLKHAKLANDESAKEVLRLTLTARGPANDEDSLSDGLDLGHRVIVLTFKNITSQQAHEYWELEQ